MTAQRLSANKKTPSGVVVMPSIVNIPRPGRGGKVTKYDLQQYRWIRKNINRLQERLIELKTEATKMTTQLTEEPKGTSNADKLSSLVAQIIDTQDEISRQLQEAYRLELQIESAIDKLPEREKYLIRARYVEQKTWEQICVDMNYSWKQTHRIHARALKMLA